MHPISVRIGDCPGMEAILRRHPGVHVIGACEDALLSWTQGNRTRSVVLDDPAAECAGLIELMDNNPLVCAERCSVPGPSATLALLCLGPLARAGALNDVPTALFSFEPDEASANVFVALEGWPSGVVCGSESLANGSVETCAALAPTAPGFELEQALALYDEAYARSFFVRVDQTSAWDPSLVSGTPDARLRLSWVGDDSGGLLKILALADKQGKLGAAQVAHMFNVMCGFEESLGLA